MGTNIDSCLGWGLRSPADTDISSPWMWIHVDPSILSSIQSIRRWISYSAMVGLRKIRSHSQLFVVYPLLWLWLPHPSASLSCPSLSKFALLLSASPLFSSSPAGPFPFPLSPLPRPFLLISCPITGQGTWQKWGSTDTWGWGPINRPATWSAPICRSWA